MSHEVARVTGIEAYCLGKIISECGEFAQVAGNALCFGIGSPDHKGTGRLRIEEELGDIHAAMTFAALHGVISGDAVSARSRRKLQKLLDPDQRDNLGRPLAPQPPETASARILPICEPHLVFNNNDDQTIAVSGQVAAALRQLTGHGKVSVDTLLRRLLKLGPSVAYSHDGSVGSRDSGTGLVLPEGFEIFRVWQGQTYRAKAQGGQWVTPDGKRYDNLNRLNASIGKPNPENAWICWKFVSEGREHLLNSIRPMPKPRNRKPRSPRVK